MHEYGRIHSCEEHGTCYFIKPCGTFLKKQNKLNYIGQLVREYGIQIGRKLFKSSSKQQ